MAAVAAGAAIAGGAVSAYGAIKGAQDQAELDREKAELSKEQADELINREQINDALRDTNTFRQKLDFQSAAAGTGHEGSGIGSQLEIQRQSDLAKVLADHDANFQAQMLLRGGQMYNRMADNTEEAGYISAAGSLLGGAGRAAAPSSGVMPRTSGAESLPSFSGG